jgi:hypothetical protein
MDLDGTDAFNRLLERVEELVAEGARTAAELNRERHKVSELEREKRMLVEDNKSVARFERFVESTPERMADWQSYIAPKPKTDDDMPF